MLVSSTVARRSNNGCTIYCNGLPTHPIKNKSLHMCVHLTLSSYTLVGSITVLVKVEPTNSITLTLNNELVYTTGLAGGVVVL